MKEEQQRADLALLERYLASILNEAEKKVVEERLLSDEGFINLHQMLQDLPVASRGSHLGSKLEFLRGLEENIHVQSEVDKFDSATVRKMSPRRWWWMGIAASVLVVVGVFWGLQDRRTEGPSDEYSYLFEDEIFESTIEHSVLRSGEVKLSPEQERAYGLYVLKDFQEAIPLLEDLWIIQRDSLAYKYLGISYLGVGNNLKGKQILDEINNYQGSPRTY